MKHRISAALTMAMSLSIPAIASAQFERVDTIVRDVETRFQENFSVPATPDVEVADPSLIEYGIIRPLEWELRKLQIQLEILDGEGISLEKNLAESEHLLQNYSKELLQLGITSRTDINKKAELAASLEQQMRMLEAESEALKASLENARSDKIKKLKVEEASVKLKSQEALLKAFKEQYDVTKQMIAQGMVSSTEAMKLEARLEEQQGALQLARLDVEKAMAEMDAYAVDELTKTMEVKAATKRHLEDLKAELGEMAKGLKMLDEKDLQRSRLTFRDQRMSELTSSKSTLQMEHAYLNKVIDSYRANLDRKGKETEDE